LALQNGVDVKTVSSMLGHYDAGFTLRTYTHVTRQMQQKAASNIEKSDAMSDGRKLQQKRQMRHLCSNRLAFSFSTSI
jgi:hypothetical protein